MERGPSERSQKMKETLSKCRMPKLDPCAMAVKLELNPKLAHPRYSSGMYWFSSQKENLPHRPHHDMPNLGFRGGRV